jgi:hypothetical protein
MTGLEAPWELIGSSPERGRKGKEERGRGHGLGATWGASRGAPWEGLQALLTASRFLFSVTCCVQERNRKKKRREEREKKRREKERKKERNFFPNLEISEKIKDNL